MWWKRAVVYQIYPRSFRDADGDGNGDLTGIIEKLPYLHRLGVDVIWLSPVYRSPMVDNGYDIADYYDIDPMFGSMQQMDELIARAKSEFGIGIVMDLVVNHTSDQHRWFQAALTSADAPERAYYVWRDSAADGGPPNDLQSFFGGPAWTLDRTSGQYFLHFFAAQQPDLNWHNPDLRHEIYRMMNWWLDRGLAGFRMDVIDLIGKEPDRGIGANGPELHQYIREMNQATLAGRDVLTVGETWHADLAEARQYSNPDGSELSMVFQFDHVKLEDATGRGKDERVPLDLVQLKRTVAHNQTGLYGRGWNSLFLSNHDLPRIVSRWGDSGTLRQESAKMLATTFHCLQGTPYIYQGEELGMTNVDWSDIERYRDVEVRNYYRIARDRGMSYPEALSRIAWFARDNARTPMQWTAAPDAGFGSTEPWIDFAGNHDLINAVAAEDAPDSIWHHYRALIELRKTEAVITEGKVEFLTIDHPDIFAYRRHDSATELTVISNFHAKQITLPEPYLSVPGALLLHSYADAQDPRVTRTLRPYESVVALARR